MTTSHTPETSAACQILYACADRAASLTDRGIIFRAIARLSGQTPMHVSRVWRETR